MKTIAIVGAGGFARELQWLIRELPFEFVGFLANQQGEFDSPVLGDFSWLESNHVDALAIGIGSPHARLDVGNELKRRFPHIEFPAIIHPSVKIDRTSSKVGEGVVICADSYITVNVSIGNFAMLNVGTLVGHESKVGEGTVLNCATICGGVNIGDRVLVGIRSTVLQYLSIGDDAVIGACSLVTKNVPAEGTWVGVPAKPLPLKLTQSAS